MSGHPDDLASVTAANRDRLMGVAAAIFEITNSERHMNDLADLEASARATLAQYEQAPVVGWVCDDFIQDPCGSASYHNCGKRRSAHITARPEVTK